MNLLVTGGCGFIGTNFIRYMFETHKDIVIHNVDKLTYAGNPKNLENIEGNYHFHHYDINETEILNGIEYEYIFL